MGWVKPEEIAKLKKALAAPPPEIPADLTAAVEQAPADAPTVGMMPELSPPQSAALDEKISRSPTASAMKNVLMEAMVNALPPHLREKVRAYGEARQVAARTLPPAVVDSPRESPTIIEGECRHD